MTETETQILDKLIELESAVETIATADPKPDLVGIFAQLDEYTTRLAPDSDPELRHFLQRKSYQKARLLLQGRNTENQRGSCGH